MHQYENTYGQFSLAKYPTNKKDNLLPFDNADKHVLAWAKDNLPPSPLFILNDDHGALTVPLAKQGFTILCYSDSATAIANIKKNLEENDIDLSNVEFISSIDGLTHVGRSERFNKAKYCLGRIPKSHSHLNLILQALANIGINHLVLGIMAKHLSKSTVKLIETYYKLAQPSLAWKKSRIVIASDLTTSSHLKTDQIADYGDLKDIELNEKLSLIKTTTNYSYKHLKIDNLPGVFAQANVDIGARLMLETIEELIHTKQTSIEKQTSLDVADLGCGNGILGAFWKSRRSMDKIHYFDDSYLALSCAALNSYNNQPTHYLPAEQPCEPTPPSSDSSNRTTTNNQTANTDGIVPSLFNHTDCLGFELAEHTQLNMSLDSSGKFNNDGLTKPIKNLDIVLCNPPFHSQFKLNDQIAFRMFKQAKRALNKNGSLIVVGNRHLNYHIMLKSIFKNCKKIKSNNKFVVLEAII